MIAYRCYEHPPTLVRPMDWLRSVAFPLPGSFRNFITCREEGIPQTPGLVWLFCCLKATLRKGVVKKTHIPLLHLTSGTIFVALFLSCWGVWERERVSARDDDKQQGAADETTPGTFAKGLETWHTQQMSAVTANGVSHRKHLSTS